MKILYITQWFDPEPAFKGLDFAKALADRGHEVEIATGFPNYPGGTVYPGYRIRPWQSEWLDGLRVYRLCLYPSHDRSSMGRVLNYLSFFMSVLVFGLLNGRKYDVVYVYHPPITPGLAAALFTRLHRRRLILDIQDLWPDSVAASGMLGGRAVSIISGLCNFVYRASSHVVVQSEGMRERLVARGVPAKKLTRIYNWSTYQASTTGSRANPPSAFLGHLNVVYGGNLGQAQALEFLIDAFVIAHKQAPELRLHLFGGGVDQVRLSQRASTLPQGSVTLYPPVPRSEMDRIFDRADILAVHLKDDPLYTITVPSKTQHYLACGKPILAGLSGEAADILKASGAAIVCPPGNAEAMADGLLRLATATPAERDALGERARDYYSEHFSMSAAIDRTTLLIESTDEAARSHKRTE